MNLQRPLRVVTPTLEGEILRLLAQADKAFTGREIQRMLGVSQEGVRVALRRLAAQGIVRSETAGRATMFELNRRHIAAPYIEGLASLRLELIERIRQAIGRWETGPVVAVLFGSVARGDADETSDIDVFVVRPKDVDEDDPRWREQISSLEEAATAWTGNDTRTLEFGEKELPRLRKSEPVIQDVTAEGIVLAGSLATLRREGATR
jgi:predicted nucleotidyltransferase